MIQNTDHVSGPESLLLIYSYSWALQLLYVSAPLDHFVDGVEGLQKTQSLQTTAGLDLPQSVIVIVQAQLTGNLIKTKIFT